MLKKQKRHERLKFFRRMMHRTSKEPSFEGSFWHRKKITSS